MGSSRFFFFGVSGWQRSQSCSNPFFAAPVFSHAVTTFALRSLFLHSTFFAPRSPVSDSYWAKGGIFSAVPLLGSFTVTTKVRPLDELLGRGGGDPYGHGLQRGRQTTRRKRRRERRRGGERRERRRRKKKKRSCAEDVGEKGTTEGGTGRRPWQRGITAVSFFSDTSRPTRLEGIA